MRHELNSALREYGGHIGYEVHPAHRRQGIATFMLRELLATPKARSKTIENGGGVLEKVAYVERIQRETCYYWITI